MVTQPQRFDVLVASNLFGDILTDIGAAIQGGMGLAASANLPSAAGVPGLFEPVHGSAPDIAGSRHANPIGAVVGRGDDAGDARATTRPRPGVMARWKQCSERARCARPTWAAHPRPPRSAPPS